MAKILIVDDEEQVRSYLKKALATQGHTVVEASNGNQALELYQQHAPDLVITDILMPGKGGLAVLMEIKKMKGAQKFIAISGGGKDGRMDFLSTAASIPGVRALYKPFSHEDLMTVVAEQL